MVETDYRVLPNFASKIKGGHPVCIYGNGSQTRTFCYATDAMVGFFLVANTLIIIYFLKLQQLLSL